MGTDKSVLEAGLSRRGFLTAAGVAAATASLIPVASADAAPPAHVPSQVGDPVETPLVGGLHLQFGADPSRQMVVSWHTRQPVERARVLLGGPTGHYERTVPAEQTSYTDAKSGQVVYAYHAHVNGLAPSRTYLYAALHDGVEAEFGSFHTAPRGRAQFTFTSFGDQGTPTTGRVYVPPPGSPPPAALPIVYVNDNLGSPESADVTAGVERVQPLFHLFNGDLCYANLATDRVRTWADFWTNNSRSARNRPWMPAVGNHEIEAGNGHLGYDAYQTYFALPRQPGQSDVARGMWYAFTVGSVRVISLDNNDVCYQDAGDIYNRSYSHGAQKAWLEGELRATRRNRDIDWIVVCMHQVVMSTAAPPFNGADLGIRQEWLPLFDEYEVDLVVCGHEHHYERSHPVRGQQASETRTPIPVATNTEVIDTTKGTVHMVLGGGGTSAPSNNLLISPPGCRVITGVGDVDPKTRQRTPIYVFEPSAPWLARRDAAHTSGFAAFTVDPGDGHSAMTRIHVTYYNTGPQGALTVLETFSLQRPRRDRPAPGS